MEVIGQFYIPAALSLRKEMPVPFGWADWVGSRVSLDAVNKRTIAENFNQF
jgi:hypothetical protein